MRVVYLWVIMLTVLGSSCQHFSLASLWGESALPADSLLWVGYAVNNLKNDTTLFAQPCQVGIMSDPELIESSGLAPSHRNPGYLWTEEDSGNPNQIQLINREGKIMARLTIDGAENRDWEDIAVGSGPIPGKTYIYLADTGDNRFWRSEKIIYRFPEPVFIEKKLPYYGHVTGADVIRLKLPDGPHNVEAMLIDPSTKDLFILSKDDWATVYHAPFPQSLTQPTMMTCQLAIPLTHVTSAGVSPDGTEILIRTYGQLYYYKRQPGETIPDALKRAPLLLPLAYEAQGEAVGWAIDGSGYYTTCEKLDSAPQAIYYYQRKP